MNTQEQQEKIDVSNLEELSDSDLESRYEDLLNEIYGEIEVCSYKYDSGRLLKQIDPTAFRCGQNDWLDSEISEGIIIEQDDHYYLA